jgi:DDE superfamily endonuclease
MIISPTFLRDAGLFYCGSKIKSNDLTVKETVFRRQYGSSSLDIASMWCDLVHTDIPESRLLERERNEEGLVMFLLAHHFLKHYPANSSALHKFPIPNYKTNGHYLWPWVAKIQGLKAKKIQWDPRLDDHSSPMFAVTVDGTDMKWREKQHPDLPIDTKYYSHKFNACALKYELAISIFTSKLVWMNGPFRGGKHDMTIFRDDGLKDKLQASGKLAIADGGYKSSDPDESMILAVPSKMDSRELSEFKARARCRHESFNGRIKNFSVLTGTFRHDFDKFKVSFEAVCVIIQYQMDNGAELYAV